nr:prohibitin family protein [Ameyamaea chiangmaiensis]
MAIVNPFYQVVSGFCGVLLNFGSVQPTPLTPGLHGAVPVYQTIVVVSTQPQTVTSEERAATHDLQNVHTAVSVTFPINAADAPDVYRDFRPFDSPGSRIIGLTASNDVKAVTASYNAEDQITRHDAVDSQIKDLVVTSLLPYPLSIEAVNISNLTFSPAYEPAFEARQVAQPQAVQATAQANTLVSQSLTPVLLQQKALDRWSGTLPVYLSAGPPRPSPATHLPAR